jgi:F-type H+-transporting ATPase subunit delta
MSDLTHAARPYARAIFELAKETNSIDAWNDSLAFMGAVMQDKSMLDALEAPTMTEDQKAELAIKVGGEQIDDQCKNLIKVMAENGRLTLFPEIYELFEVYRDEDAGVIEAQVVSAQALSADDEKRLADALNKRLGREIKIVSKVDESLLGGAIIRAGDIVIDGSIQGRLDKLSTTLGR